MYRHISIFVLKDKNEIPKYIQELQKVGQECPTIINSIVKVNLTKGNNEGPGPLFGDVIQIIDFKTLDDLNDYPQTPQHMDLFHCGIEMEHVTAFDYDI